MKLQSLMSLALAVTALGGGAARAQYPGVPNDPTPGSDGWSYRHQLQSTSQHPAPLPPLPPSTTPMPPPTLLTPPALPGAPAHDCWVLSVVQQDGQPRLQVESGTGMQALSTGLTFKVPGPKGEASYTVSAGKQVQVKGGSFQASADRVTRQADGVSLGLEGNVRLRWQRGGGSVDSTCPRGSVNLQTGHVALDLDPQPVVQPCCYDSPY